MYYDNRCCGPPLPVGGIIRPTDVDEVLSVDPPLGIRKALGEEFRHLISRKTVNYDGLFLPKNLTLDTTCPTRRDGGSAMTRSTNKRLWRVQAGIAVGAARKRPTRRCF